MQKNKPVCRTAAVFFFLAALLVGVVEGTAQELANAPGDAALSSVPKCPFAGEAVRLEQPLTRVTYQLAGGLPLRVVAVGSSSTAGAGASAPSASYPSRLEAELRRHFPGHELSVLNRGVNGEEARDMLARFDRDVIAEEPNLVLWQLGTNSVLRDRPFDPGAHPLHEGLARLKAVRADIVLVDPQYAPRVIAKPDIEAMVGLLGSVAHREKVDLFPRFGLMRRWHDVDGIPFETFVSPDGLHLNDWSYACFAKALGASIAEAATRPTATAAAPR
jgi:lysophospholipase L1-like esterase